MLCLSQWGGKHSKAMLFFLWHFWWVRIPRPSQVTGVTFLMRQTFLCVQAMWLFLSKMWLWSTVNFLLIVWQEKEGESREILQWWGVGWTPRPLAAWPALAFCWTVGLILPEGRQRPWRHRKGAGLWGMCLDQIWMMKQEVSYSVWNDCMARAETNATDLPFV